MPNPVKHTEPQKRYHQNLKPLFYLFISAFVWAQPSPKLFDEIEPMIAELSELTGLTPLKRVDRDFITRAKLKSFMEKRVADTITPAQLHAEELAMKLFGLVPPDFDLKNTTVSLVTEQAAAFYDYKKKRMFVLEGQEDEMQQIALFHELAHALADQHFNLAKYILKSNTDDAATARGAVMEGQAQWLMMERMAKKLGQSLIDSPRIFDIAASMSESAGQFSELGKAPLYIRESLLFPYSSGMLFQNAVLKKLGKNGFGEVFKRAPVSTQQILHPEKYFDKTVPTEPKIATFAGEKKYKLITDGALGEFDVTMLIREYAGKQTAEKIGTHWKGGRLSVWERKSDKHPLLAHTVEFDSTEIAAEYLAVYKKVLEKKSKSFQVDDSSNQDLVLGSTDSGHFEVRRNGAVVSSLEGIR